MDETGRRVVRTLAKLHSEAVLAALEAEPPQQVVGGALIGAGGDDADGRGACLAESMCEEKPGDVRGRGDEGAEEAG